MASTAPPNPLPPDVDVGPMLTAVSYAFIVPSVLSTALRIWVRAREKILGGDDYTIMIAAALSTVLSALSILAVEHGKGRHIWYLSGEQTRYINMLSWINQIVLFSSITFVKASICLLVLRIKNTKAFRWFLYTVIALLVTTNIIPIIALLVECHPIYRFWDRTAVAGQCRPPDFRIYSIWVESGNGTHVWISLSSAIADHAPIAYSILTDFICSLLPIAIVWNLQLAQRKKIGVCVLMAMGLTATAFAALRASSLSTNILDTTYSYTYTGTWMVIETNLGIIAANLAPLRGLVVRFFPRIFSTHSGTDRSGLPTHNTLVPNGNQRAQNLTIGSQRRRQSFTSDQSEVPLKDIVVQSHQREVRRADSDGLSSNDAGEEADRHWKH